MPRKIKVGYIATLRRPFYVEIEPKGLPKVTVKFDLLEARFVIKQLSKLVDRHSA